VSSPLGGIRVCCRAGRTAAGAGDDESSKSQPTGAARAESNDDDTTNDARIREELDDSLMKNNSSSRNRDIHCELYMCDIKVPDLIMDGRLDIGLTSSWWHDGFIFPLLQPAIIFVSD